MRRGGDTGLHSTFPLSRRLSPEHCNVEAKRSPATQRGTACLRPLAVAKGRMLRLAVAMGLALPGLALAAPAAAQSFGELPPDAPVPEELLTAEQILERAQERLRPPSVRRPCKLPENPNEIVVCGRDPNENRVESPTERAIADGRSVADGLPRAPNV